MCRPRSRTAVTRPLFETVATSGLLLSQATVFSAAFFGLIVAFSFAASYIFNNLALFAGISSGMKIIILTVVISLGAAILFPVKEGGSEHDA